MLIYVMFLKKILQEFVNGQKTWFYLWNGQNKELQGWLLGLPCSFHSSNYKIILRTGGINLIRIINRILSRDISSGLIRKAILIWLSNYSQKFNKVLESPIMIRTGKHKF